MFAVRAAARRGPGVTGRTRPGARHGLASRRMRFSLLLEAPYPRPWTPAGDGRRIRALVDVAVRAEALGFGRVWVPEHHLQEERHHAGPPEVVLSAIAARTRRLGLGLGPLLAHPHVQHPVRAAAAIASLDALSGGRVAVAFADPRAAIELGAFGIARATSRDEADRTIERIARLLHESPFAGEDEPGGMPVRQLVPRPQARPHPALWRACDRPADVRVAAEGGLGAFVRAPLEPHEAAEWVTEHREVRRGPRCRPLGAAIEPGLAVTLPVHVAEDPATALREGLDAAHLHRHLREHHERFGAHRPGRTRIAEEFERLRTTTGHDPAPVLAAPDGSLAARVGGSVRGAIGDPAQVVELLARYRDAGVDEVLLVPPLGLVDPDALERSLALLGRDVLPHLADDEDDDLVEGEDPTVEAALKRRRPAPAPRETVVLPREDGPLDDVPAPAIGMGSVSGAVGTGEDGTGGANGRAAGADGRSADAAGPGGARRTGRAGEGSGPGSNTNGDGGAGSRLVRLPARERLKDAAGRRGGAALTAVLDRGSPQLVRRTVTSEAAMLVVFRGMARSLRGAARAGDLRGDLQFDLEGPRGTRRAWTVSAGPLRAVARRGPSSAPTLVLRTTADDLLRLVSGDLDAGDALLEGRLDLEGDLALAVRMGDLFKR